MASCNDYARQVGWGDFALRKIDRRRLGGLRWFMYAEASWNFLRLVGFSD
jgi:hypothetical protein